MNACPCMSWVLLLLITKRFSVKQQREEAGRWRGKTRSGLDRRRRGHSPYSPPTPLSSLPVFSTNSLLFSSHLLTECGCTSIPICSLSLFSQVKYRKYCAAHCYATVRLVVQFNSPSQSSKRGDGTGLNMGLSCMALQWSGVDESKQNVLGTGKGLWLF